MISRLIPQRALSRMGRRGLVLMLFGVAWLIQGAAYFLIPEIGNGPFWYDRLPHPVQGVMWLVAGSLSIITACFPRRRNDTVGFLAVSAMPMLVASSYLVGAITKGISGDPLWLLGVLGFSIWGVVTLALGVIASWPEPEE